MRFVYQYVVRLGFLDGIAGLDYCLMISMYEHWIELKMLEARGGLGLEQTSAFDEIARHIDAAEREARARVEREAGASDKATRSRPSRGTFGWRGWCRRVIWPRTPFRPLWRFFESYLLRLGLRRGRAGWHLALLRAGHEQMITLCYKDKAQRRHETSAADSPVPGEGEGARAGGTR